MAEKETVTVAVLFNADDPKYNCTYGCPICNLILNTRVLQRSGLRMQILSGDVLTHEWTRTPEQIIHNSEQIYFGHIWNHVLALKLRATYRKNRVFSWVIHGITHDVALQLHGCLLLDSSYLGMHGVDLANKYHKVFYHELMVLRYLIHNESFRLYCDMQNESDRDDYFLEDIKRLGFTDVGYEDRSLSDEGISA